LHGQLIVAISANGWHHVGFRTRDLERDVWSLERFGFWTEYRYRAKNVEGGGAAMMVAHRGTRVELRTL
jgi:hypothetical protein